MEKYLPLSLSPKTAESRLRFLIPAIMLQYSNTAPGQDSLCWIEDQGL